MRLLFPRLTNSVFRTVQEHVYDQLRMLEQHSPTTARHSRRVAQYTVDLAIEYDYPWNRLRQMGEAGLLHDLGKCRIPCSILDKKEGLTDSEWAVMMEHIRYSVELAECSTFARRVIPLHHQFRRGKSYPRSGKERRQIDALIGHVDRRNGRERRNNDSLIQQAGQILSVADSLDALISARSYKGPKDDYEAIQVLACEFTGDEKLLIAAAKRLHH